MLPRRPAAVLNALITMTWTEHVSIVRINYTLGTQTCFPLPFRPELHILAQFQPLTFKLLNLCFLENFQDRFSQVNSTMFIVII